MKLKTGCDSHYEKGVAECLVEEDNKDHRCICLDHQVCLMNEYETDLMLNRTLVRETTARKL